MENRYHVVDFESRSPVDIKKCGGYVYAMHPDTQIIMLAVLPEIELLAKVWIAPRFRHLHPTDISNEKLAEMLNNSPALVAHNAPFERMMWRYGMSRHGYYDYPIEKWHCTSARASMCGYPRDLDSAVKYITQGKVSKDKDGHRLMLKLSKPRKFVKKELHAMAEQFNVSPDEIKKRQLDIYAILAGGKVPQLEYDYHDYLVYHEKEDEYTRFADYARQDVIAEKALMTLPTLPPNERKLWIFDQKINDRGVQIDVESVAKIVNTITHLDERLSKEAIKLTKYQVSSLKSPQSVSAWLHSKGIETDSTDKAAIQGILSRDIPDDVRRFLEIRQGVAKSSVAKFDTMLKCAAIDGRARGMFIYHGASTGRWAGALIQPHNLPRTSGNNMITDKPYEYDITEGDIQLLCSGNLDLVSEFWKNPKVLASDCIRPMLVPKKGNEFLCADFSAIEGRGLAWLANEKKILEGYEQGLDMYKVTASGIYRITYEEVDGGGKGVQRGIGKVGDLALGFGGGVGAMLAFGAEKLAPDYETLLEMFPPKDLVKLGEVEALYGTDISKDLPSKESLVEKWLKSIVKSWRDARPDTVAFWYGLVKACVKAFATGKREEYDKISFLRQGRFMTMRLPNGRNLYYPEPKLEKVQLSFIDKETGEEKVVEKILVTAMTVDGVTKQFVRKPLNHLILSENATQAICRDLLVEAMFRVEEAGYPVVMTVHDEILSEVPKGKGSLKEFEELMSVVPEWAKGFPIKAVGWRGTRYKK